MEIYLLCKQKCNSSCLPQLCSLTIVTTLFTSANPCGGVHPECSADFYRIMEWFPVKHLEQVYCYITYCHVLNPAPHSCSLYCCQNQPRCKRWYQKMGSIYAWLYKYYFMVSLESCGEASSVDGGYVIWATPLRCRWQLWMDFLCKTVLEWDTLRGGFGPHRETIKCCRAICTS